MGYYKAKDFTFFYQNIFMKSFTISNFLIFSYIMQVKYLKGLYYK